MSATSRFSPSNDDEKQEVAPVRIDPAEHLHLAKWFVGRWLRSRATHGHLADDLIGAAYLGLCEAAKTYDPTRARWTVWAAVWMRREVVRCWNALHDHVHMTRNGRKNGAPAPSVVPIDAPVYGDGPRTWSEVLPADGDLEAALDCARHAARLQDALADLPRRERRLIELRFGIGGTAPLTLVDVGAAVGVGRERARQIEALVLTVLGRSLSRRGTQKKRRIPLASHRDPR